MSVRITSFAALLLLAIIVSASPVIAISISCSSGGGGEFVSSSETFDLDDKTALQESVSLDAGSIFKSRQAEGSGNNNISESIAGTDYSLENNIQSSGSFSTSTLVSATSDSGSLSQDVAGMGSMSVSVSSIEGSSEASQAASVSYGALDSVQAIAAGEGVYTAQSTGMAGLEGSILSGAVGSENVMGATGTFTGAGLLEANLAASISAETGRASASGTADLDGTTLIDSSSFDAVSSQSLGMGLEGLRDVGDGDIGSFDVNVLNLEQQDTADDLTSQSAALQTAGGSASSYKLTGYKWHQNNPQIQLYLNTNNAPSGITAVNSQAAITAAANTWDDAVAKNIFADGTTVIIDNTKIVDNPLSSIPVSDGYNVHGWANLGSNYLGMCRWWSNGVVKDGYKSILEADIWYASDKAWTTDLSKATGSTFDLQSVAVHELGHTIGMGDIYPTSSDFAQVMNSYDGAQRVLGNGDLAGAQIMYGSGSEYTWLSIGDGTFDVKSFLPWDGYPIDTGNWVSGDIDGDGTTDLIHIIGENYVYSWLSKGDGTYDVEKFSPWSSYVTSIGNWQIGDLNGDEKSDLLHLTGGSTEYSWISKGDGTFSMASYSPWSSYVTSIGDWQIGDLNGDGKSDLLHLTGESTEYSWISKGDGTFSMASYSPWSSYVTSIGNWQIGDLNGDEKSDLLHLTGGSTEYSWISKGDGTFSMASYSPWSSYVTSIGNWQIGDLNGDGKSDLLHLTGGSTEYSWISKGDGTFSMASYSPWSSYVTSIGNWQIGDLNGDGKSDLLHLTGGSTEYSWISKGDGTFNMAAYSPLQYNAKGSVWKDGDINGDGKTDLFSIGR